MVKIELNNLFKSYGSNQVLKGVNVKLASGNFYALLGKNGQGKSTLMRIIMRQEEASSGNGTIFDRPLDCDEALLNERVGYVSENINIIAPSEIGKLLYKLGSLYKNWDSKIFDEIISHLQLDLKKDFSEFSRGQKMQILFAFAMGIRPEIILLDEITSVLDAYVRSYFMTLLGEFKQKGGIIVLATNIVTEVQFFANHLLLLDEGVLKVNSSVSEISKHYCKLRFEKNSENSILKDKKCIRVGMNSDESQSYIVPREIIQNYSITDSNYDRRGITIEEIFIYYTRE